MNKKNLLIVLSISFFMVDTAMATRWWRSDDMGVSGPAIIQKGHFAEGASSWSVLSPNDGSDEARNEVSFFAKFMSEQAHGKGQHIKWILNNEDIVVEMTTEGKTQSMKFTEGDAAQKAVTAYLQRQAEQDLRADWLLRRSKLQVTSDKVNNKRSRSPEVEKRQSALRAEGAAEAAVGQAQDQRERSWSPDPVKPVAPQKSLYGLLVMGKKKDFEC